MSGTIALATFRTTWVLGLRLVIQAGTLLIIARLLGPGQFGAFIGVTAMALMLGALAPFGMNLVLLGEISRNPARRNHVLRFALPTTLICGSGAFVVFIVACCLLSTASRLPFLALLSVGIAETLLQPLLSLCVSEHHAHGRIASSQLLQLIPLALRLLAAAAVYGMSLGNPLLAYALGYGLASLLAVVFGLSALPSPWPSLRRWRLPRGTTLREAAGFAAINITKVGPAELDKTMASQLLPLSLAGVYAAGARVIGAATLPVIAMMLSALPRLFRDGQTDFSRTTRLVRWVCSAALGYSIALAIVLWFVAPIFDQIFGKNYQGVGETIRWLCFVIPGLALRVAVGSVLMALGRPWMRASFEVLGLFVLIATGTLLTERLGSVGMPLALSCSEWSMATMGLLLIYIVRKRQRAGCTAP